jgi:hypothetical protein
MAQAASRREEAEPSEGRLQRADESVAAHRKARGQVQDVSSGTLLTEQRSSRPTRPGLPTCLVARESVCRAGDEPGRDSSLVKRWPLASRPN